MCQIHKLQKSCWKRVHPLETSCGSTRRQERKAEFECDEERGKDLRRPQNMMLVESAIIPCDEKPFEDRTHHDEEKKYIVRREPLFKLPYQFFAVV
ncbi:hypothetical protein AC249_AIPGENE12738 [Exaiptasia diaphana]|nr:hypothetical protein AC249_AIPGENE12738 [Exaiptasia diaphana]